MRFPFKARAALLLAALLALSLTIFGQTSSGEVNGSVTDQAGAAVSAATVKLINQSTGIETQASLNKDGRFTFVNVKPGIYALRVEAQGFKTAQTPAFNVGVSQTVTQDLELTVGDVSQTVEVSAVGELVQRSSVELGAVISEREVQELPLNGRNFREEVATGRPGVADSRRLAGKLHLPGSVGTTLQPANRRRPCKPERDRAEPSRQLPPAQSDRRPLCGRAGVRKPRSELPEDDLPGRARC